VGSQLYLPEPVVFGKVIQFFGGMGWSSIWWSTDLWYGDVWIKLIVSNHSNAYLHAVNLENNVYGFFVRCLKD
jgi:hypothetical protein